MHLPRVHRILRAAARCSQTRLSVSRARNESIVREMVGSGLIEATFPSGDRPAPTLLGAVTEAGRQFLRAFDGESWATFWHYNTELAQDSSTPPTSAGDQA